MDVDPYSIEPDAYGTDPQVHPAVWLAFVFCGFVIILTSGFAAVMVAILALRGQAVEPVAHAPRAIEPVEVRRQHALDAIRSGDYDRAVAVTSEAVAADPGQAEMAALRDISNDLRDRLRFESRAEPVTPLSSTPPNETVVAAPLAPRVERPARRSTPPDPRPEPPAPEPTIAAPPVPPAVEAAPERPPEPAAPTEPVRIYVHVPGTVKARVLQDTLQSRLAGSTVRAFGSFREFTGALASDPPHAVLAPRAVLEDLGLPAHLQGLDPAGSPDQRYVLLARRPLPPSELEAAVIGTVDLAGRDSSTAFVVRLLAVPRVAQVKRVSQESDLLALLQFGAADAVLLPEPSARAILQTTHLDLVEIPVVGGAGLPAVSVLDERDRRRIEAAVSALGTAANARLGVTSWTLAP